MSVSKEAIEAMRPHIEKLKRCAPLNEDLGRVVVGQVEAINALAEIFDKAEAALSTLPIAGEAAPEGWQLVPVKPTMEMVKNAAGDHEGESWLPHSLWASMLAAAPVPPSSTGKDGGQEVEAGDLRQRIEEVFAWRKTGVLPGEALRDMATAIRERHGEVFSQGDALSMAEKQTAEEAMCIVLSRPQPASTALVERLTKALESARHYVVDAIDDDGGIDSCDIIDRSTLEKIDAALSASQSTSREDGSDA